MSVSVDAGLGIPSPKQLGRGALAQEGPVMFIISWVLIGILAYTSAAVGLIVTVFVGFFATFMVGVGLVWLIIDRLRGGA